MFNSKIGKNNRFSKFGVSAIKKRNGAAPKRHPIGLKFFGGRFFSDVIPKSLMEHKLSKLVLFWDTLNCYTDKACAVDATDFLYDN